MAGKRCRIVIARRIAGKIGNRQGFLRSRDSAAKDLGERTLAIGPGFQIGGEIDLLGDGVKNVARGADEEDIVITEMLAKPRGPIMKCAVIAGVVGILVDRIEFVTLARRVRVLRNILAGEDLARLGPMVDQAKASFSEASTTRAFSLAARTSEVMDFR